MARQKIQIEPLPQGSHRQLGKYDNASRWYPVGELYNLPGAFTGRSPTRAWPHSYLKHFYTRKFARILAHHEPLLYMELQGIDKDTETGKLLIAKHVELRITGEA